MFQSSNAMKRFSASLTLVAFAAQIVGCTPNPEEEILNREYSKLVSELEADVSSAAVPGAEGRLRKASELKTFAEQVSGIVDRPPVLEGKLTEDPAVAKEFVQKNQNAIMDWLDQIDGSSRGSLREVYGISKEAFESHETGVKVRDSMILYFGLQYQKIAYRKLVQTASPLLLALGAESLRNVPEVAAFRDDLTRRVFTYFGSLLVSKKDLRKVVGDLAAARKKGDLPKVFDDILARVHQEFDAPGQNEISFSKGLSQLPQADQAKFKQGIDEIRAQFEQVSFLYSPEQNLSVFGDILTVIGNLTWGLVNTMVGVVIVLATMAVSPFTDAVDFPTFRLSANGRMIYVNVTGMSPIPGKMSMGLFELDNATSWEFASGHEGAHAIQSALLGPLYLPVILATYAVCGFDQGPMEQWADDWANI